MIRIQFDQCGSYFTKLWPKWKLNPEQIDVWFEVLRHFTQVEIMQSAKDAYAAGRWKEPKLPELLDAARKIRRNGLGTGERDFDPAFVAQVQREEDDEAAALQGWTAADLEEAKLEIIRMEPGMCMLGHAAADGTLWRHFICERFIQNRAVVYPNGTKTHLSRDDWWARQAVAK